MSGNPAGNRAPGAARDPGQAQPLVSSAAPPDHASAATIATPAGLVAESSGGAARPFRSRWLSILSLPELMVAVLLVVTLLVSGAVVPHFLDASYLLDRSCLYMETGMMALGMTFVIVGGHIDLSCAATLALVGALDTTLNVRLHVPMPLVLALTPFIGAMLGAVNGSVVAGLGLPSLVVTLGTLAAYRGLAQVLIGDKSLPMAAGYLGLHRLYVANFIPVPLVIFAVSALVLSLVLHKTVYGRWVFAIGTNAPAAKYAGVPAAKITFGFFVLNGVLASAGALMMLSRLGVARYDLAVGSELDVITAVVLGGASIVGGRGTIGGTVIALLLIAALQTGMGLASIKIEYQLTADGALLIVAVLASNLFRRIRR